MLVLSLVYIATFPLKYAPSVFLVHFITALIHIPLSAFLAWLLLPLALAMLEPIRKHACVVVPVLPLVLPVAFGLPVLVLPDVGVFVLEEVSTVAVAQTSHPFTLVTISIFPQVNSIAVCLGVFPLADVRIPMNAFPDTVTILDAIDPFSIEDFPILPLVDALTMSSSVLKVAQVSVSIDEEFKASAFPLIVRPIAFIYSASIVDYNALSLSLPSIKFASIDRILVLLDPKLLRRLQFLIGEQTADHLVLIQKLLVGKHLHVRLSGRHVFQFLMVVLVQFEIVASDRGRLRH